MKRLDKFLVDCGIGSRSEVKNYIKKSYITVNNQIILKADEKISDDAIVCFKGKQLKYEEFVYYMFHKPSDVVSATEDSLNKTVIDFFGTENKKDLFPVGRLDKDTEGLLIVTNDGMLGHKLTSPRYGIVKKYYVILKSDLTENQIIELEQGLDIGEKNLTAAAKLQKISERECYISITEGKFHQVKRMFAAVDNQVLYLKRISMGEITLDEGLEKGCYRRLTNDEMNYLLNI